MSAWRSVENMPETDPRSGVRILLYSPNFGIRTGEYFNSPGHKWANVSCMHGNAFDDWGATHWMPLPAEPTEHRNKARA